MRLPRSEKERALAEKLFVCDGKSGSAVAAILGAGSKTVQRWARDGRWAERRRLRRADSQMASVEILRRERDRLILNLPAGRAALAAARQAGAEKPQESDESEVINSIHKLTQTIERMDPQPEETIGSMLATMHRYATFVTARADQNEHAVLKKWVEQFLNAERRKALEN